MLDLLSSARWAHYVTAYVCVTVSFLYGILSSFCIKLHRKCFNPFFHFYWTTKIWWFYDFKLILQPFFISANIFLRIGSHDFLERDLFPATRSSTAFCISFIKKTGFDRIVPQNHWFIKSFISFRFWPLITVMTRQFKWLSYV